MRSTIIALSFLHYAKFMFISISGRSWQEMVIISSCSPPFSLYLVFSSQIRECACGQGNFSLEMGKRVSHKIPGLGPHFSGRRNDSIWSNCNGNVTNSITLCIVVSRPQCRFRVYEEKPAKTRPRSVSYFRVAESNLGLPRKYSESFIYPNNIGGTARPSKNTTIYYHSLNQKRKPTCAQKPKSGQEM